MFDLLTLEKNEDYFQPFSARKGRGVYFTRYIGYDDDVMVFFRIYLDEVQRCGVYIQNGIRNPLEGQVSAFFGTVDPNGFCNKRAYVADAVNRFLAELNAQQRGIFADAVYEMLRELESGGTSQNILKNAFVKFMCWAKYVFVECLKGIGGEQVPKVLYEGGIGKYEVFMLHILSRSGCDVLYIHCESETDYLGHDPASVYSRAVYSKRRGKPATHFSAIDLTAIRQAQELRKKAESVRELVNTNAWMGGSFLEEIFRDAASRGPSREIYYNLFGRYLGCGEQDAYLGELYRLKLRLEDARRTLIIQDTSIANPTLDEVKGVASIRYQRREELIAKLAAGIEVPRQRELTAILQGALARTLGQNERESLPQLYNHGMKLLCWLKRYTGKLFDNFERGSLPVFLYYGRCSESEAEFLNLLAATPVDVLLICPDKTTGRSFAPLGDKDRGTEILLEGSSQEIFPFPRVEPRLRAATAAYNAQQELDSILYTDTGLFRHKQFTRCNPVTLKTTYDEIEIYWREEARYRPNFETGGGRVVVPNIFAKVCGVRDRDLTQYFRHIQNLLTPKTILVNRIPFITPQTPNPIKAHVHRFFKDGEILPDAIKRDAQYQYDYLNDSLQDFILEKIQLIIQWGLIQSGTMGVEYAILSTLLNLDRHLLRLIQEFDFTGEIPKVVVVDVEETMMSLEDCIFLAFLNLAGFDIVIFTPTGYRNVEKYIRREAFEEYQIGQYCFNVRIPPLQIPATNARGGGLLSRLLGKGG